jgi:hypothetical protein
MARIAFVHALVVASIFIVTNGGEAQVPGEAVTVVDPIDIPPEHDPLARAWDLPEQRGGFYLRASTSIGVQNTRIGPASWESEVDGYTTSGFASGYGLDLGGFVRPWLALHLDTSVGVLWSGSHDEDIGIAGSRFAPATRVVAYGIAPAVTFFTPRRFFFKPAFGVGFATRKAGRRSDSTDPGFYMHLVAGKDLYRDQHFAFGLQFEVAFMRLGAEDELDEARVRQFLFGVSFGFDSL